MKTPEQKPRSPETFFWIMAKSNGDPSERVIIAQFKKALCIYESEEAIDKYIAPRSDLFGFGALGKKKKIPLTQILEILSRRKDYAFVSVDYPGGDGEHGLRDRIEYAKELVDGPPG